MISNQSIREEADAIYVERVLRARETPGDQKMVDGIRMFERSCGFMRDGIRHQFPNATPEEVEQILQRRLDIVRELQEVCLYVKCPENDV